jgi:hypothetical protein
MAAPQVVRDLIARFTRHKAEYHAAHYNEARLRADFLDPYLRSLAGI